MKRKYVKCLRSIIFDLEKKDISSHCPWTGTSHAPNDLHCCELCYDFINLGEYIYSFCPCGRLKGHAIRRAKAALVRWDKGIHKWQKEKS